MNKPTKAAPTASRLILHLVLSLSLLLLVPVVRSYMDLPDWYAIISLVTLTASFLYAAWFWVLLPWHIARVRSHHNTTAILVTSLVGLVTFGIAWLVALIWAFTNKAQGA